jgi:hypothetical protein
VLWVRNNRKDFGNLNIDAQRWLHIRIVENGVRAMRKGVTQFLIVADARNMTFQQMRQMAYMKMIIQVFLSLYPDRVAFLLPGPVNSVLRGLYRIISPLLPRNVQQKIRLLPSDTKSALSELLPLKSIPVFFGGTNASHDCDMLPIPTKATTEGEGAEGGKSESKKRCGGDGPGVVMVFCLEKMEKRLKQEQKSVAVASSGTSDELLEGSK